MQSKLPGSGSHIFSELCWVNKDASCHAGIFYQLQEMYISFDWLMFYIPLNTE